jgi:hypothetical protein
MIGKKRGEKEGKEKGKDGTTVTNDRKEGRKEGRKEPFALRRVFRAGRQTLERRNGRRQAMKGSKEARNAHYWLLSCCWLLACYWLTDLPDSPLT